MQLNLHCTYLHMYAYGYIYISVWVCLFGIDFYFIQVSLCIDLKLTPSKPAVDLFLLQKTNEEKDGLTKMGNETLKEYEKEFAHWTLGIRDKDPDIVEFNVQNGME